MSDVLYVTTNEKENSPDVVHEDPGYTTSRPLWARWYDQYFGRLEGESDDDNSDALVCEG
jgi:hypothetical protein